jgi:hypothetical protein
MVNMPALPHLNLELRTSQKTPVHLSCIFLHFFAPLHLTTPFPPKTSALFAQNTGAGRVCLRQILKFYLRFLSRSSLPGFDPAKGLLFVHFRRDTGHGSRLAKRTTLTSLFATPTRLPASVDSKELTRSLSRLDATLTKNGGGIPSLALLPTCPYPVGATSFLVAFGASYRALSGRLP